MQSALGTLSKTHYVSEAEGGGCSSVEGLVGDHQAKKKKKSWCNNAVGQKAQLNLRCFTS